MKPEPPTLSGATSLKEALAQITSAAKPATPAPAVPTPAPVQATAHVHAPDLKSVLEKVVQKSPDVVVPAAKPASVPAKDGLTKEELQQMLAVEDINEPR